MRMAKPKPKLPWLNPGDRFALAVVAVVLAALLGVHFVLRAGIGKPPPQFEPGGEIAGHRVDINSAAWWELQTLQRIGEKRAKAIVEHRVRHGLFKTVDELVEVHGIGKKTLRELRPHLTVGGREAADESKQ